MAQHNLGDLLAAIKVRWGQRNLTLPISEGFPRERTPRPYVVVSGLAAASKVRTNKSKVSRWRFDIHVFDTPSENVWAEMRMIVDAIEYAPLTMPGGNVLQVRNTNDGGTVTQEDYYAHGVTSYLADASQAVNYSPG